MIICKLSAKQWRAGSHVTFPRRRSWRFHLSPAGSFIKHPPTPIQAVALWTPDAGIRGEHGGWGHLGAPHGPRVPSRRRSPTQSLWAPCAAGPTAPRGCGCRSGCGAQDSSAPGPGLGRTQGPDPPGGQGSRAPQRKAGGKGHTPTKYTSPRSLRVGPAGLLLSAWIGGWVSPFLWTRCSCGQRLCP